MGDLIAARPTAQGTVTTSQAVVNKTAATGAEDPELWRTAKAFETAFMAEMLKYSGLAETSESFSGGYGEDAFKSFMIEAYAESLTDSDALGLAKSIYAELKNKVAAHEQ